jgi:L-ascorbate peroxidase
MRFFTLAVFVFTATALSFPDASLIANIFARKHGGSGGDDTDGSGSGTVTGQCPVVWTSISKQLTKKFLSGGQCNPDARAAIRLIFHDCGGPYLLVSCMIINANTVQRGIKDKALQVVAMAA